MRRLLRHASANLLANLVAVAVSALAVLMLPRRMPVEAYGFWHLFMFYTAYAGFLHLGWADGIYLRYGGRSYSTLDFSLLGAQAWYLTLFQTGLAALLVAVAAAVAGGGDYFQVALAFALCFVALNVRTFFQHLLQTTGRLADNARIVLLDRLLYMVLLSALLFGRCADYRLYIAADLVGRYASLFYAVWCCRELTAAPPAAWRDSRAETRANIAAGSQLMLSTLCGLLVLGAVRLGIEQRWDVATFARVSLAVSLANLLLQFINTLGMVLFPFIRRLDSAALRAFYLALRELASPLLLGCLLLYWPVQAVLLLWLPHYVESARLLALLFPLSVPEGLTGLLLAPYLKSLRLEKELLRQNLSALAVALVGTALAAYVVGSLPLTVCVMTLALTVRAGLLERTLARALGITRASRLLREWILQAIFLVVSWSLPALQAIIIYTASCIAAFFLRRDDLRQAYRHLRNLPARQG